MKANKRSFARKPKRQARPEWQGRCDDLAMSARVSRGMAARYRASGDYDSALNHESDATRFDEQAQALRQANTQ